jgi:hypothetical protein
VTPKFDLKDADQGFAVMASANNGKVVFYPQGVLAASHDRAKLRVRCGRA